LNINLPTAIGHLHLLWWWAMDFADSGDLSSYSDEDIADAVMWEGDAKLLVTALTVEGGFIDHDRKLHDWDDYVGRLLRIRRANVARSMRARSGATVPNTTQHNQTGPLSTPPKRPRATELPEDFDELISEEDVQWAMNHLKLSAKEVLGETAQFKDSARAKRRLYADWPAAWKNWMRNEAKWRSQRAS
jgi:hypothetical protein